MAAFQQDLCLSEEEYLKLEETSRERHEYLAGRIFSMVGASRAHNIIVSNLHRQLYDPVKATGCHTFISDMKVKIDSLSSFYYPDLVVSCESSDPKSVYLTAPCLIVEVLSPSTQGVDLREKMLAYRNITSLKEYMVVFQDEVRVEVYRKDASGNWHCQAYVDSSTIELMALPGQIIVLDTNAIYSGSGLSP
jgi:Uma2 family endonuclease